ncbi:putative Secreted Protein [Cryptosporidium xiaoi]|uniref:Secreted Protein n=1 Tax=Cryptosporidium xiaoi TaxID=659607 RepID=A0AAV9Y170_9CRYT
MSNILLLLVYVYFTLCIYLNVCISTDEQKLENRFSPPWRTSLKIRELQFLSKQPNLIYSFIEEFRGEYSPVCDPKSAIHNDTIVDSGSISVKQESSNFYHIPSERRSLKKFKKLSMEFNNLIKNPDLIFREIKHQEDPEHNLLFFPRIKHFRKKLPVLTPEPYQRLMTFAIEVCMIPKLWYLELIHCMYMGMAPFFKGMLMSYSLQDVVGSAVMTIGYLDSKFSIENCHRSVSMVSDDNISPNYEYICDKMKTCLESKVFENGEYARFREEFEKRIEESYRITEYENINKHELASYYLKLAISTPYSNGFEKDHNSRNFLPIRTMVSMISTANMVKNFDTIIVNIVRQFNAFYYLISYGTMISIEKYFVLCNRFLETNVKINFKDKKLLFGFLCKDFISVGFIDESFNIMGDDEDKFIQAIQPSRILRKNYADVIPSMPSDESLESFGKEWLEFAADEFEITEAPLSRPATGRFYKSKLLSKTRKRGMRDPRSTKTSESTKVTHLRTSKKVINAVRKLTLPRMYLNAFLIDPE